MFSNQLERQYRTYRNCISSLKWGLFGSKDIQVYGCHSLKIYPKNAFYVGVLCFLEVFGLNVQCLIWCGSDSNYPLYKMFFRRKYAITMKYSSLHDFQKIIFKITLRLRGDWDLGLPMYKFFMTSQEVNLSTVWKVHSNLTIKQAKELELGS